MKASTFVLLLLVSFSETKLKVDNLLKLAFELKVTDPYIIANGSDISFLFNIFKKLNSKTQFVSINSNFSETLFQIQNGIVLEKSYEFLTKIHTWKSWLVLSGKNEKHWPKMHQKIYFFNDSSNILTEKYQIKSKKMQRNLAIFEDHQLKWFENMDFVDRRSNFLNETIFAVVLPAEKRTFLRPNWKKIASKIVPESWEVTNFIDGIAIDHINAIAKELNFRLRHFYPFEKSWGSFDVLTDKATGLAKYLKGDAFSTYWIVYVYWMHWECIEDTLVYMGIHGDVLGM